MQNNHNNEPNPSTSKKERTFWWIVLGLLAPPIGIAFYFQMKKERPNASRSVLLGTILGFGVIFLAVFILGIFLGTQAA
jgi:RsiW-degrading membrane proteinase PrsW (M82 family)